MSRSASLLLKSPERASKSLKKGALFGICNLRQRRISLFLNAFKREIHTGARATSGAHTKSTFLVDDFSPEFPGGRARGHRSKSTGYQNLFVAMCGFYPGIGKMQLE
ncbi:hypothetical protein CDAR_507231 [Caerostris darwini]|uniref:Uncharacterized protein n=1 Tax=Caerostris darwini TaxID=1538125 RepID=A0AAV4WDI4_9ARAC|nr:hypothetical protein CDAR_507231 [Caerostris darwini]